MEPRGLRSRCQSTPQRRGFPAFDLGQQRRTDLVRADGAEVAAKATRRGATHRPPMRHWNEPGRSSTRRSAARLALYGQRCWQRPPPDRRRTSRRISKSLRRTARRGARSVHLSERMSPLGRVRERRTPLVWRCRRRAHVRQAWRLPKRSCHNRSRCQELVDRSWARRCQVVALRSVPACSRTCAGKRPTCRRCDSNVRGSVRSPCRESRSPLLRPRAVGEVGTEDCDGAAGNGKDSD